MWHTRLFGGLAATVILAASLIAPHTAQAQGHRACDGVVTVSLTNVRKGPGLEYDIITQIPYGEKVIAVGLDLTAKWYIVYLPRENNIEARWVYYRNMKITKQCVKALTASAAVADDGAR